MAGLRLDTAKEFKPIVNEEPVVVVNSSSMRISLARQLSVQSLDIQFSDGFGLRLTGDWAQRLRDRFEENGII